MWYLSFARSIVSHSIVDTRHALWQLLLSGGLHSEKLQVLLGAYICWPTLLEKVVNLYITYSFYLILIGFPSLTGGLPPKCISIGVELEYWGIQSVWGDLMNLDWIMDIFFFQVDYIWLFIVDCWPNWWYLSVRWNLVLCKACIGYRPQIGVDWWKTYW